MSAVPYVSVAMITFNHERYIDRSIESVLSQEFDDSIEIIIGDDGSTDATGDRVKDYANKYPNIVGILREKNIGATANLADVLSRCRGKYIAILEGDDYWTYQEKLKKQISFLETNPDYVACYHKVCTVDEASCEIEGKRPDIGTDDTEYYFGGKQ